MKKPKIVGHLQVLNGIETLPYVVESVLPCVDQLLIVEGAERFAFFMCDPDTGLSTDGTTAYLRKLQHREPEKVRYEPAGFIEMTAAREQLVAMSPADTDWMLRVDADEVFHPRELRFACQFLVKEHVGMAGFHHFWKDWEHCITSERPSHWNELKPRIEPWQPGIKYPHPDFTDQDRRLPRVILPLTVYHLSWARHPDRVWDRLTRHNLKWEGFTDLEKARAYARQHPYFTGDLSRPLYQMDRDVGMKVVPFTGRLPPVLEKARHDGAAPHYG